MKRALIIYESNHGQTQVITNVIVRELRARGVEVTTRSALDGSKLPRPDDFDLVVLGSRIQFGRHASAIVAYLHEYGAALRPMPTAFFSVSMAAANGGADPNGYLDATFTSLGWRPNATVAFAGALPYRQYNWILRFVMKQIATSAGHATDTTRDHSFTDWNQVRGFAAELVKLAPRLCAVRV
jgi:menaquinone-dependent protoporphyrinogen oxidase